MHSMYCPGKLHYIGLVPAQLCLLIRPGFFVFQNESNDFFYFQSKCANNVLRPSQIAGRFNFQVHSFQNVL